MFALDSWLLSSKPSVESGSSNLSLLALRRFLRGTFRRLGTLCLAVALVLHSAMQPSSPDAARYSASSSLSSPQQVLAELSPSATQSPATQLPAESLVSAIPANSARLLTPHLTQHRLTSARLSVPRTGHHKTASLPYRYYLK